MSDRHAIAAAIDRAEPETPPSAHYDADAILNTTARLFGLEVDVLWGASRASLIADARAVAALLMRAHTSLDWQGMGDMLHRSRGACASLVHDALGQPHRLSWAKAVQIELERTTTTKEPS